MPSKKRIMLITYPDSLGSNLKELNIILNKYFKKVFGSVHILPFYPSSADRGFSPINYDEVDANFGTWNDIKKISNNFNLMFDFMVNHISRQSVYYKDFAAKKNDSDYAEMFIQYNKFWSNKNPSNDELALIYKRKPRPPYIEQSFSDGSNEKIWCTFDSEQIDLNINSCVTKNFIKKTLADLSKKDASFIRLDAFAYLVKKQGTNCFFVEPEIWEILEFAKSISMQYGVELLPEIHEHYSYQLKLSERGYWAYDFSLPMLVLHALYSGSNQRIINWLEICPRKQFTTLDTHDGIGIVDVYDLLSEKEIETTKECLYSKGANIKKIYSSSSYNNLDIYQINCTYYSALGNNDNAYILARAIQFFTPGIPQIYYVGLLCGENDVELINKTMNGRDINRHSYTINEVKDNLDRLVVKRLLKLMEFRNNYEAFDGDFKINKSPKKNIISLEWKNLQYHALLEADLAVKKFTITYFSVNDKTYKTLDGV